MRGKLQKKEQKGITLIALIISIIVMLILAGVSLNAVIGDNGIISQAQNAKEQNEIAKEKEGLGLAILSIQMKEDYNAMNITKVNLEKALKEQLGKNIDLEVVENGDNSFIVKFNNTDTMYYVENSGNIIDNDNILKISTEEELKAFRDEVNNGNSFENRYIILKNNISVTENWIPIGNAINTFAGNFIGDGHEININVEVDNYAGLFGNISGGSLSKIIVSGSIKANEQMENNTAGGITAVISAGNVSITNCVNKATVIGCAHVGGIIGLVHGKSPDVIINNCINDGNITSTKYTAGGIIGSVGGYIKKVEIYNSGNWKLLTGKNVGGIVATQLGTTLDNPLIIQNSYNIGNMIATYAAGGILGQKDTNSDTKLNNCYNAGRIENTGVFSGGIMMTSSWTKPVVENCYWCEGVADVGIYANNINIDDIEPYTEDEILHQDFLDTLNDKTDTLFSKWTKNASGYPIIIEHKNYE